MTRPLIDRFGYVPPEVQCTLDRMLHPDAGPVYQLDEFIPQTDSDVPLLFRPGIPIEELWAMIPVPYYSKKICHPKVNIGGLGPALEKRTYEEPAYWVAFDPERGKGQPAINFANEDDVATASEVFTAMIMLEVHDGWSSGVSATQLLARYQFDDQYDNERGYKMVPWCHWNGGDLYLGLEWYDDGVEGAAIASVRKC